MKMKAVRVDDKNEIEAFLRQNVYLHIYAIGDLDDFFWAYTTWYALKHRNRIQAIVLLYTAAARPTLHAMSREPAPARELLQRILHLLPAEFHAHLSPHVDSVLRPHYNMDCHGEYYRMALTAPHLPRYIDCSRVIRLGENDLHEIQQFYDLAYPQNWFDARMLKTNYYFGIRRQDRLISMAGVHVCSEKYSVAALGNIATHPEHRSAGLATTVTARLCRSLLRSVDHIGLNVKADNGPAIAVYKKLGFEVAATYYEYTVHANERPPLAAPV